MPVLLTKQAVADRFGLLLGAGGADVPACSALTDDVGEEVRHAASQPVGG
jgi:hypothetical protein